MEIKQTVIFSSKKEPHFCQGSFCLVYWGGRATQLKAFHFPAKSTIS